MSVENKPVVTAKTTPAGAPAPTDKPETAGAAPKLETKAPVLGKTAPSPNTTPGMLPPPPKTPTAKAKPEVTPFDDDAPSAKKPEAPPALASPPSYAIDEGEGDKKLVAAHHAIDHPKDKGEALFRTFGVGIPANNEKEHILVRLGVPIEDVHAFLRTGVMSPKMLEVCEKAKHPPAQKWGAPFQAYGDALVFAQFCFQATKHKLEAQMHAPGADKPALKAQLHAAEAAYMPTMNAGNKNLADWKIAGKKQGDAAAEKAEKLKDSDPAKAAAAAAEATAVYGAFGDQAASEAKAYAKAGKPEAAASAAHEAVELHTKQADVEIKSAPKGYVPRPDTLPGLVAAKKDLEIFPSKESPFYLHAAGKVEQTTGKACDAYIKDKGYDETLSSTEELRLADKKQKGAAAAEEAALKKKGAPLTADEKFRARHEGEVAAESEYRNQIHDARMEGLDDGAKKTVTKWYGEKLRADAHAYGYYDAALDKLDVPDSELSPDALQLKAKASVDYSAAAALWLSEKGRIDRGQKVEKDFIPPELIGLNTQEAQDEVDLALHQQAMAGARMGGAFDLGAEKTFIPGFAGKVKADQAIAGHQLVKAQAKLDIAKKVAAGTVTPAEIAAYQKLCADSDLKIAEENQWKAKQGLLPDPDKMKQADLRYEKAKAHAATFASTEPPAGTKGTKIAKAMDADAFAAASKAGGVGFQPDLADKIEAKTGKIVAWADKTTAIGPAAKRAVIAGAHTTEMALESHYAAEEAAAAEARAKAETRADALGQSKTGLIKAKAATDSKIGTDKALSTGTKVVETGVGIGLMVPPFTVIGAGLLVFKPASKTVDKGLDVATSEKKSALFGAGIARAELAAKEADAEKKSAEAGVLLWRDKRAGLATKMASTAATYDKFLPTEPGKDLDDALATSTKLHGDTAIAWGGAGAPAKAKGELEIGAGKSDAISDPKTKAIAKKGLETSAYKASEKAWLATAAGAAARDEKGVVKKPPSIPETQMKDLAGLGDYADTLSTKADEAVAAAPKSPDVDAAVADAKSAKAVSVYRSVVLKHLFEEYKARIDAAGPAAKKQLGEDALDAHIMNDDHINGITWLLGLSPVAYATTGRWSWWDAVNDHVTNGDTAAGSAKIDEAMAKSDAHCAALGGMVTDAYGVSRGTGDAAMALLVATQTAIPPALRDASYAALAGGLKTTFGSDYPWLKTPPEGGGPPLATAVVGLRHDPVTKTWASGDPKAMSAGMKTSALPEDMADAAGAHRYRLEWLEKHGHKTALLQEFGVLLLSVALPMAGGGVAIGGEALEAASMASRSLAWLEKAGLVVTSGERAMLLTTLRLGFSMAHAKGWMSAQAFLTEAFAGILGDNRMGKVFAGVLQMIQLGGRAHIAKGSGKVAFGTQASEFMSGFGLIGGDFLIRNFVLSRIRDPKLQHYAEKFMDHAMVVLPAVQGEVLIHKNAKEQAADTKKKAVELAQATLGDGPAAHAYGKMLEHYMINMSGEAHPSPAAAEKHYAKLREAVAAHNAKDPAHAIPPSVVETGYAAHTVETAFAARAHEIDATKLTPEKWREIEGKVRAELAALKPPPPVAQVDVFVAQKKQQWLGLRAALGKSPPTAGDVAVYHELAANYDGSIGKQTPGALADAQFAALGRALGLSGAALDGFVETVGNRHEARALTERAFGKAVELSAQEAHAIGTALHGEGPIAARLETLDAALKGLPKEARDGIVREAHATMAKTQLGEKLMAARLKPPAEAETARATAIKEYVAELDKAGHDQAAKDEKIARAAHEQAVIESSEGATPAEKLERYAAALKTLKAALGTDGAAIDVDALVAKRKQTLEESALKDPAAPLAKTPASAAEAEAKVEKEAKKTIETLVHALEAALDATSEKAAVEKMKKELEGLPVDTEALAAHAKLDGPISLGGGGPVAPEAKLAYPVKQSKISALIDWFKATLKRQPLIDPRKLVPTEDFARHRSADDVAKYKQSFETEGWNFSKDPIEVCEIDGKLYVMNGHHRWKAAMEAGMANIPYKLVTPESYGYTKEKVVHDAKLVAQGYTGVGTNNLKPPSDMMMGQGPSGFVPSKEEAFGKSKDTIVRVREPLGGGKFTETHDLVLERIEGDKAWVRTKSGELKQVATADVVYDHGPFTLGANPPLIQHQFETHYWALPPAEQKQFQEMMGAAAKISPEHAALLNRMLSLGCSVAEVAAMHAWSKKIPQQELGKKLAPSLTQAYEHGCVPTAFAAYRAYRDFFFARLAAENPAFAKVHEAKALEAAKGGGKMRSELGFSGYLPASGGYSPETAAKIKAAKLGHQVVFAGSEHVDPHGLFEALWPRLKEGPLFFVTDQGVVKLEQKKKLFGGVEYVLTDAQGKKSAFNASELVVKNGGFELGGQRVHALGSAWALPSKGKGMTLPQSAEFQAFMKTATGYHYEMRRASDIAPDATVKQIVGLVKDGFPVFIGVVMDGNGGQHQLEAKAWKPDPAHPGKVLIELFDPWDGKTRWVAESQLMPGAFNYEGPGYKGKVAFLGVPDATKPVPKDAFEFKEYEKALAAYGGDKALADQHLRAYALAREELTVAKTPEAEAKAKAKMSELEAISSGSDALVAKAKLGAYHSAGKATAEAYGPAHSGALPATHNGLVEKAAAAGTEAKNAPLMFAPPKPETLLADGAALPPEPLGLVEVGGKPCFVLAIEPVPGMSNKIAGWLGMGKVRVKIATPEGGTQIVEVPAKSVIDFSKGTPAAAKVVNVDKSATEAGVRTRLVVVGDVEHALVYDPAAQRWRIAPAVDFRPVIAGNAAIHVSHELVQECDAAREKLSPADRAEWDRLIFDCRSPEEQMLMMRTFAARARLGGKDAAHAALKDALLYRDLVTAYFKARGKEPTPSDLLSLGTADGLVQYYEHSCALTAVQLQKAQLSPLEAMRYVMMGREGVLAEQKAGLEEYGGTGTKPATTVGVKRVIGSDGKLHELPPATPLLPASDGAGLLPSEIVDHMNGTLGPKLGDPPVKFAMFHGDANIVVDRLNKQLSPPPPEGVLIGIRNAAGAHAVVVVGVHEIIGPNGEKTKKYLIRDPDGATPGGVLEYSELELRAMCMGVVVRVASIDGGSPKAPAELGGSLVDYFAAPGAKSLLVQVRRPQILDGKEVIAEHDLVCHGPKIENGKKVYEFEDVLTGKRYLVSEEAMAKGQMELGAIAAVETPRELRLGAGKDIYAFRAKLVADLAAKNVPAPEAAEIVRKETLKHIYETRMAIFDKVDLPVLLKTPNDKLSPRDAASKEALLRLPPEYLEAVQLILQKFQDPEFFLPIMEQLWARAMELSANEGGFDVSRTAFLRALFEMARPNEKPGVLQGFSADFTPVVAEGKPKFELSADVGATGHGPDAHVVQLGLVDKLLAGRTKPPTSSKALMEVIAKEGTVIWDLIFDRAGGFFNEPDGVTALIDGMVNVKDREAFLAARRELFEKRAHAIAEDAGVGKGKRSQAEKQLLALYEVMLDPHKDAKNITPILEAVRGKDAKGKMSIAEYQAAIARILTQANVPAAKAKEIAEKYAKKHMEPNTTVTAADPVVLAQIEKGQAAYAASLGISDPKKFFADVRKLPSKAWEKNAPDAVKKQHLVAYEALLVAHGVKAPAIQKAMAAQRAALFPTKEATAFVHAHAAKQKELHYVFEEPALVASVLAQSSDIIGAGKLPPAAFDAHTGGFDLDPRHAKFEAAFAQKVKDKPPPALPGVAKHGKFAGGDYKGGNGGDIYFIDAGGKRKWLKLHEPPPADRHPRREVGVSIIGDLIAPGVAAKTELVSVKLEDGSSAVASAQDGVPAGYTRIAEADLKDPRVVEQLQWLRAVDYIGGVGDRHANDIFVDKATGKIVAIDHEATSATVVPLRHDFGGLPMPGTKNATALSGGVFPSPYPKALADRIKGMSEQALRDKLAGIWSPAEIDAAVLRLRILKAHAAA
ncbi:MAG: ParB N-terminal domain-containing protein [Deltaproteobacteria bacterium]|nr:ParB N-terminal domain-containing protein [Deltaproteobacteria bacterium]